MLVSSPTRANGRGGGALLKRTVCAVVAVNTADLIHCKPKQVLSFPENVACEKSTNLRDGNNAFDELISTVIQKV